MEQASRRLADVAEALDGHAGAIELEAASARRVRDRVDDALAGRVRPPDRAADGDRLAGHDARHRVAPVHRDGVHDPGHRLGVGADVRRRDVRVRADDPLELRREPAGQRLELLRAHRARIAGDASFGAAERDVDQGRLPGHPHRQRTDIVKVGPRVEPKATLRRPSRDVVLDAVALEDLDRAVIPLDREVDRELALGHAQHGTEARLERDVVGRCVELSEGRSQRTCSQRTALSAS